MLKIEYRTTVRGISGRIMDLENADEDKLVIVLDFIKDYRGDIPTTTHGNFTIPKKWDEAMFESLLKGKGLVDFEAIDLSMPRNAAKVFIDDSTQTVASESDKAKNTNKYSYRHNKVGFGKHNDTYWKDIPQDYLTWLHKNATGWNLEYAKREVEYREKNK